MEEGAECDFAQLGFSSCERKKSERNLESASLRHYEQHNRFHLVAIAVTFSFWLTFLPAHLAKRDTVPQLTRAVLKPTATELTSE